MIIDSTTFPDPEKTPYVWRLDHTFRQHLHGQRIFPDQENIPDVVCYPGHEFIIHLTEALARYGAPGLWNGDVKDFDFYKLMSRGMADPFTYLSRVPFIARYILHLWILREFVATNTQDAGLTEVFFYLDLGGIVEPAITGPIIGCEWYWIYQLLEMAMRLDEPRIDTIPGWWGGWSKSEVVRRPDWQEKKAAAERTRLDAPYTLTLRQETNRLTIIAVRQYDNAQTRLIGHLAVLEACISESLRPVDEAWPKLRASDQLRSVDVDDALRTRMNWQREHWRDAYLRDAKLQTTDMRMGKIQDWTDPLSRSDMEGRSAAIARTFKRESGYGPGNRGRVEANVGELAQALIKDVLPDLVDILKAAWPKRTIDGDIEFAKVTDLARGGKLKCLGEKHLRFLKRDWKRLNDNDRLDLCSKVVAEYLEEKTGTRYHLESLRQFIELPR